MKIYNYAPDTSIFHAEGLADESPLEPGVFLIPAYATTLKPPKATLPEVAVFKNGTWNVETLPPPPPEPEPEPAPELPTPRPDYRGFYDSLLISTAYQNIRAQAVTSLPLTLASVEFIAAMSDAKAGAPNEAALQTCINNIAATATDLTEADWLEIGSLLTVNNLADLYVLPG